ncbi:MAG: hypothetical protein IID44_08010 [Planctomycetes bacterium]|nr:hypothetical protein [Planctomycetota bacterium]
MANWKREKLVFADEGVPLGIRNQRVDCGCEFVEPAKMLENSGGTLRRRPT